ncbi:replication protein A 70 kDa DNA-binding subunit B-like [Silene latifolia]|uniref:replication protein A 70 kDa DNA-binding subunit B-like n=1 Tax=Silene latifolia TaxID=37657 RepID=UPI003D7789C3
MALQITSTKISKLAKYVRNVEIVVCVVCLWKGENYRNKGEIYGIEMILVDAEGDTIQASISKSILYKFKSRVTEGRTYRLGKFTVADNVGYMTGTKNPLRIWFEYSTFAIETNDEHIPKYGFQFTSFADIIHENVKLDSYLDIIREFEASHPIAVSENGNEWTHIDLIDKENNRLPFYVFGDYVQQVKKIIADYAGAMERPVLAVQCVSRAEWKGEVRITTSFDATRIHVNPNIQQVSECKELCRSSGSNSDNSLITHPSTEEATIRPRITFKTITELNNIDKVGVYSTLATITELDANFKWYYYSCKFCRAKAALDDDILWRCTKDYCKGHREPMTEAIPRFQVRYHISDEVDVGSVIENGDENSARLLLFETQLEGHIKKTATQCLSDLKKAGIKDGIPKELEVLIGKTVVCKIEVSRRYNIEQKSKCYTALSIIDEKESIAWWRAKYKEAKEAQSQQGDNDCITPQKHKITEVIDCEVSASIGKPITAEDHSTSKVAVKIKIEKN